MYSMYWRGGVRCGMFICQQSEQNMEYCIGRIELHLLDTLSATTTAGPRGLALTMVDETPAK